MDGRKTRALCTRSSVTVKVLAAFPGPSRGDAVAAQVIRSSGNSLRLRLQFPISCGASIEVSDGDQPLLGAVCSCAPDNGAYLIGVRLMDCAVAV